MERERLGSRLGFILIAAGCAIGLGNIWKFPYMVGQYGGGAFVLIYLVFLIILGVPLLSVELSIGRASQRSPVNMCRELEPEGTRWHLHGYLSLAGVYLLMSFYTVITGWILRYAVSSVTGGFTGLDASGVSEFFVSMSGDPVVTVGFMVMVVIIGFTVCSLGVQGGLERVTKWMMLALLAIMVFMAAYAFTMPGAAEGLRFYLVPDIDRMMDQGILNVVVAALSQAFFTLSLGIGSMAVFGSYIGKEHRLFGESVRIASLDLVVAFMAGLIIFPACFSYGVPVGVGPSLIFETLPNIFNNLPGGNILGFLFFLFGHGFLLGFCLGGFVPGIGFFDWFGLFGFFLGFLLRCIDEGIGNLRASGSLLLPSRSPAHDEPGVVIGSRPVLLQIVGYQGYGSEEIGITDIFGLDVLQGVGYEGFHLVDVVGHAHG